MGKSRARRSRQHREPEDDPALECAWTWYVHVPSASYTGGCTAVGSMHTVCEFWKYYHNVVKTRSFLTHRVTCAHAAAHGYAFFRAGVLPEWEHPGNRDGGEFVMRSANPAVDVENLWLALLLACVGEAVPLQGVRFIAKAPPKLEAWYAVEGADKTRAWLEANLVPHGAHIVSHKLHARMAVG
jgi:hypothetical protein